MSKTHGEVVGTDTCWKVTVVQPSGIEATAEFDTEANARKAWDENQPSMLSCETVTYWAQGEALETWKVEQANER